MERIQVFTITKATLTDYRTIVTLKYQLYLTMAEVLPAIHKKPDNESLFFPLSTFEGDLSSTRQVYFIATEKSTETNVAFLSIGKRSSLNSPVFRDASFANIDEVYVVPEYRKRGAATDLVNAAFEWAKENDLQTVKTGVYVSNSEGYHFWEKMGFTAYKSLIEVNIAR